MCILEFFVCLGIHAELLISDEIKKEKYWECKEQSFFYSKTYFQKNLPFDRTPSPKLEGET